MWVFRAGKQSLLFNDVLKDNRIFLAWEGFKYDLSEYKTLNSFKEIVASERKCDNRTTISNLSCQLDNFVNKMKVNDYVIIPSEHSRFYTLALISGEYSYTANKKFPHSRSIIIIKENIPRDIFSKTIQYSLGAYRTIFHAKRETEIITALNQKYNLNIEVK